MATETEMTPAREPGRGQAPVLVTRLGGQQRIFPVGTQVRVGRDPTLELVSVNPLVSRQCHGVITSDQDGASYVDQSRRGTFLDGKQLSGPLRITESVVLRLGDPATGEELGITPPLTSFQIARNHGRRVLGGRMRRGALVSVAVAAVAALATLGFFTLRSAPPAGGALSGGLRTSVLRHAEAATVRLMEGSPSPNSGWGSGTLISPTGLILTNVHVAKPQASGFRGGIGDSGLRARAQSALPHGRDDRWAFLARGRPLPGQASGRGRVPRPGGGPDIRHGQREAGQPGLAAPALPEAWQRGRAPARPERDRARFPRRGRLGLDHRHQRVLSTFVPDPQKHVTDPRFELETRRPACGWPQSTPTPWGYQVRPHTSAVPPGLAQQVSPAASATSAMPSAAEAPIIQAPSPRSWPPAGQVPQRPPGQFWQPPQQPWAPAGSGPQSWPPASPPPGQSWPPPQPSSGGPKSSWSGRKRGLIAAVTVVVLIGGYLIAAVVAHTFPFTESRPAAASSPVHSPRPTPKPTQPATPSPTGPTLAAGLAPLVQLLPGDIDDPATQCQNDPPPYSWDMPGRVKALTCTDPGLAKGKLYAYQMDSQGDYEATWQSYSKVAGFTGASPGQDCPPAKGGVGTFPTDSKMFPHQPGQVLWCVMVDVGNGPQPTYTWTLPNEDAFFVAAGAPKSSFAALDKWWSNHSLPLASPSPAAS